MKSYGYAMLDRQVITDTAIRNKLYEKLRKLSDDTVLGESLVKVDKRFARIIWEHGAFQIFADEIFAPYAYRIWNALPFKGKADENIAVTSGRIIYANTRLERGKVIFFAEKGERYAREELMLDMTLQQLYLIQSQHSVMGSSVMVRYGEGWKQGVSLQRVRILQKNESGSDLETQATSYNKTSTLELTQEKWVVVSDTEIGFHMPVEDSHYVGMEFSKLSQAVRYIEGYENELVEK